MKSELNKTREELIAEIEILRAESEKREKKLEAITHKFQSTEQQLRAAIDHLEANNQQLLASEERLKEAEIIAGMGNFTWDIGTGEVTWSDGLHFLLGYDKSEQLDYDKVNAEIHHPDDLERITAWLNACIASGKSSFPANEYRLLRKDGKVLHVQTTIKLLYKDDKPVKIIGTVEDISKRKLAEIALREQLRRNEQILQTTLDGYILADSKGSILDVNPSYCQMIGYSSEELRSMNIQQLEVQLSPEEINQRIELMLRDGGAKFETRHKGKDGQVLDLDVSTVIMMQDQEPLVAAFVRDITERKHAEQALREKEQLISAIINTSPALVYVYDMDKQTNVFSSSGLERILGYTQPEIEAMGADVMTRLIHPDDMAGISAFQQQIAAAADEDVLEIEYRVRHADGGWRFIRSFERPFLRHADGSLRQKVGVALDVTRLKLAEDNLQAANQQLKANNQQLRATNQELIAGEKALKESELKFQKIIHESFDGISVVNEEGKIIVWNKALEKITGIKKAQTIDRYIWDVETELIARESTGTKRKDEIKTTLLDILKTGKAPWLNKTMERNYVHPDGTVKIVSGSMYTIKTQKGYIVVSVSNDITESKLAEEKLKESEELFSKAFRSSPIAISITDQKTGKYIQINNAWSGIYEYTEEEAIGKTAVELGIEDNQTRVQILDELQTKGSLVDVEIRHRTKSGAYRWILFSTETIMLGGVPRVLSTGTDITDRKQAEEAYKEAQANLQALLDNRKDSIWSLDRDYNYVVFNKPYADIILQELGVRIKKGMNAMEIHPKEIRAFWKSKFDSVFNGEYVTFEFSHTLDGKEYFFQVFMNPIISGEEVTGVSCLSMDITDRKEADKKLEEYQQHLEELVKERTADLESANKELESFSYSVSHDLKAPLRAIDGFSKILIDNYSDSLDKEGLRLLNVVRDNTKNMNTLIIELLELSRLGRSQIRKSRIEMKKLVQSIFYELTTEDARKRIQLEIGELGEIQGDPSMLKQVWINLLSNAIKYSSKEAKSIISIAGKTENDKFVYSIKDNGVGFDDKYIDKLFGVFQRLHRVDEFEGTGVGLAIVKRIINRHGGKVWAESKLGEGASFYFSLPRENL